MHAGKRATQMAGMPDTLRGQGHQDYGPGHDRAYDWGDGPSVNKHGKTSDLRSLNKGADSRVDTHVKPTDVLRYTAKHDAPRYSIYSPQNVRDRRTNVTDATSHIYPHPSGPRRSKDPKVKGNDVKSYNPGYGIQINSNLSDAIPQTIGGDPFLDTRGLDGSPNIRSNPDGAKKGPYLYNYSTNERPSRDPKSPGYSPTATGADLPVALMEFRYKTNGPVILIYKQDITKVKVDVIVNGANAHLRHGGGVARAIADAAGSELTRASEDIVARHGPVPVSGCVATPAGRLPCQGVLHAVGPKWTDTPEKKAARQLQDTFVRILEFCYAERVTSIAIPPISAGMDGGTPEKVSDAIVKGLIAGLNRMPTHCVLKAIHLVDIDGRLLRVIQTAFADEARKGAVLHRLDRPMDYY